MAYLLNTFRDGWIIVSTEISRFYYFPKLLLLHFHNNL